MADYYLEDRSRLQGQPKRTIADYVEQQGILVPRRFDSLAEAQASRLPILARIEHPQDYDGASGLLVSPDLQHKDWSHIQHEEELKEEVFKKELFPKVYCAYNNLDFSGFKSEVSFSYWEKLGGANRMVVADSAITERYHIATLHHKLTHYAVVEREREGRIKVMLSTEYPGLPPDLSNGLEGLVNLYENIRTLDHFNPQHCPIMEFQTWEGKNYFLQYHKTRDFDPSTFVLERPPQAGEIEALLVRGKTPPEGIIVKATAAYTNWVLQKPYQAWTLSEEEASFDLHYNFVFWEMMSRKRKVQFVKSDSTDLTLYEIACKHVNRSHIFKPEISASFKRNTLLTGEEYLLLSKKSEETGQDQYIDVALVSDGRKAYLRRV